MCISRLGALAAVCTILTALGLASQAHAYTPESREVRDAVDRAVRFLEKGSSDGMYADTRPGAIALTGLALLKSGRPPSHEKVVWAARQLQERIAGFADPAEVNFDIYSTALAIVFFVTLDANRYSREVDMLLGSLDVRQKADGGWGYPQGNPNFVTCDTSMTQNALLSLWEAHRAGVQVSPEMIDRALVWLLKTQDPSGGYGYQGVVSKDFTLIPQNQVRSSMTGAGLGSLYICADLLNVGKAPEKESDLPPALKEVGKRKQGPFRSRVDPKLVHQAIERGRAWMDKNFDINNNNVGYQSYNLYTLERYRTLREMAEATEEKEPAWYDEGVRYLLKNQQPEGSWTDQCGAVPATAFGILFLVRSMKISVEEKLRYGDGLLVGGRGLPKFTAMVTVIDGNVKAKPELGSLDRTLEAIPPDAATPDAAAAAAALADLPSDEANTLVAKHARILEKLAGDPSAEARLAAVRALGKQRNLDYVPTLIYALTDPDPAIVREARDSLRRISRRFQGFGPPDDFAELPPDQQELKRHEAIRAWEGWYRAIRPDAEVGY